MGWAAPYNEGKAQIAAKSPMEVRIPTMNAFLQGTVVPHGLAIPKEVIKELNDTTAFKRSFEQELMKYTVTNAQEALKRIGEKLTEAQFYVGNEQPALTVDQLKARLQAKL